jgi:hypothetical protein
LEKTTVYLRRPQWLMVGKLLARMIRHRPKRATWTGENTLPHDELAPLARVRRKCSVAAARHGLN